MGGTSDGSGPVPNYVHGGLRMWAGFADAEAIVLDERRVSYTDLRVGVFTMVAALRQHGIRPGAAVAVLAGNPVESVFLNFALHLLGCRAVWIATAPQRFRVDYLRLADVDAFVYDARTHAEPGTDLARGVGDRPVLCFGPDGLGPDLLATRPVAELPVLADEVGDEPQSLFQTGGTTGAPKLVHHRHSFFEAVVALSAAYQAAGGHRLRHLSNGGFWHVSMQVAAMMTLFTGGTLVLHDGFEVGTFLETIERERITSALLPPAGVYEVLDDPRLATTDCSSLQMLSCGGSAIAPSRLAEAIEKFGPILRPVYGMSEAPFITAYPGVVKDPARPERLRSCGQPYGDVRVEIRDDTLAVLPAGEAGEVWVTGGLLMAGYWGQPDLTRETLVDGWLRTGDVGYLDAEGYLYLVDRVKDMIVTGFSATNVYCGPVEDVLAAHPEVRQATVVGVPDEVVGEAVHAFVVRRPGAAVTPDELRARVVAELNELWAPREVEFVDALPLTRTGKVDKKALRARYQAQGRPSAQ